MRLFVLGVAVCFLPLPPTLLASEALASLVCRLEYDQEILGLFIPEEWDEAMGGDLLIRSARVIPDSGRLYCLGWQPALHLDSVSYTGKTKTFFELARRLAKNSRTKIHLTRVKTNDQQSDFSCTITPEGKVEL